MLGELHSPLSHYSRLISSLPLDEIDAYLYSDHCTDKGFLASLQAYYGIGLLCAEQNSSLKDFDVLIGLEPQCLQKAMSSFPKTTAFILVLQDVPKCSWDYQELEHFDAILYSPTSLRLPPHLDYAGWSLGCHIGFSSVPHITQNSPKNKNVSILVDTDLQSIYYLLPWLNSLIDVEVIIRSSNNTLSALCNQHIRIHDSLSRPIEADICGADIIIASQNVVELALLLEKPVIVVGERGYGGLVTLENIGILHNFGYRGRAGGSMGEHIPLHLVAYSYQEAKRRLTLPKPSINQALCAYLLEKGKEYKHKLYSLLLSVAHSKMDNERILECKLSLSPSYALLSFSSGKSTLTHLPTGKVYGQLGEEEADIINLFAELCPVSLALKKSAYRDESAEFVSFISMLKRARILIQSR